MNTSSNGQSSNGGRRIVSAAQNGSQQSNKSRSLAGGSSLNSRNRPNSRTQAQGTGATQDAQILPDIGSARMSQGSGVAKSQRSYRPGSGSRVGTPKGSQMSQTSKPGALKSFQLADQFKPDEIIENASQRMRKKTESEMDGYEKASQRSKAQEDGQISESPMPMKSIQESDIQVKSFQTNPKGPSIDFHGVHSSQNTNRSNSSKQVATTVPQSQRLISSQNSHLGSGQPPAPTEKRRPSAIVTTPPKKKINAWETFEVNQFKVRNQEPGQIISKLQQLTANDIPFMGDLPTEDLDSTDPLDSLMGAFCKIVNDKSIDFTEEVKKGIHLATGIRTGFCENMLTFICHHQKLEQAFKDSVDFFMGSLESVVKLEKENSKMEKNISQLLNLKENGIVVEYNLQRKIKEYSANIDKISEQEKQAQNKIRQLQKQLADKAAECDSLQYRLHHYEEINSMLDPPVQAPTQGGTVSGGGAVPNAADEDQMSSQQRIDVSHTETSQQQLIPVNSSHQFAKQQYQKQIRDQNNLNKRLEDELIQLREAFSVKDNSEHFRKIQELYNKLQIENKNLRIYNQKCETQLESKQRLIDHLESEKTTEKVEKAENIIKLKSEIVLLKNRLELNEEKFQNKLELQKQKMEHEYQVKFGDQVKDLKGQVSDLEKQRKDLRKRLTRLHQEHEELSNEFTKFRREKEEQENLRNQQFKGLEDKIQQLQKNDEIQIIQLKRQIDNLENKNEVTVKENKILEQKQKYLRQQTETLAKQKTFLYETLNKGKVEIEENLTKMEKTMMADNNNQAYLVSVEKCVKQAKKMADMGTAALQNIQQILQFLKIEKLHELLTSEDELDQLEKNVIQSMHDYQDEQKALMEQQNVQRSSNQRTPVSIKGDPELYATGQTGGLMIQKFLNRHGLGDSNTSGGATPQSVGGSRTNQANAKQGVDDYKNDTESILNNCPIEMASISIKLLVDILIQIGKCKSVSDVPQDVAHLLQLCNLKSDQGIEKDILDKYLGTTKQIIDNQISDLRTQNISQVDLREITVEQKIQIQDQILNPSAVELPVVEQKKAATQQSVSELSNSPSRTNRHIDGSSMNPSGEFYRTGETEKRGNMQIKDYSAENEATKLEMERLRIKLEEQKMKSKHLQLNLAGKIVVLEEQIEQLNLDREEQINQFEKTHQEELLKITQGVEQREQQFTQLCDEYRDEVRELKFKLETSWKPAEESKTIQQMEKGTRGNLYRLMKDEYERMFRANSELLKNYQASINEFVYLREDLRGSFTLAFDCERLEAGLLNMLNESMLKYYLSKTFVLDKSKFRFLRSEQLSETIKGSDKKETRIMKIILEVVAEDQAKVALLFKNVKAQIKDGTSLLYDFMPLYFGMNLGSSGFSTHHNLKDFALLSKTGQIIDGEDYVVSVMRNKLKPLIFKVIALNLGLREEFMMELSESDIYELVEGDQHILKNLEPDALIEKITTNLNLIVRDKIKVLTCEQKIFFNEIWMENMESGKNQQIHVRSPMETSLYTSDRQGDNQMQSFLTHTAARTSQLSRLQPKNQEAPQAYKEKFSTSMASQTEYEISTLYEGFEKVYGGVHRIGSQTNMRLQIQQSTKTSTLVFIFDDLTSLKKLKFSLYKKDFTDQYVIHSECMKISEGHHVLVTVEQIQEEGLLIRLYDLQDKAFCSFDLIRKQNGHFNFVTEDSNMDLLIKDDFRSFIYRLTFETDKNANEQLMHHMQNVFLDDNQLAHKKSSRQLLDDMEQKKQQEIQRENTLKQLQKKVLPRRKRAFDANRVFSFSHRAFHKDKWNYLVSPGHTKEFIGLEDEDITGSNAVSKYSNYLEGPSDQQFMSDWRDAIGVKGLLLYRNVLQVRCIFDGGEEQAADSVVTMYLRDKQVNIEVTLYNDEAKTSIAASHHAEDLFGEDPMEIPFKERVQHLDLLMDKFFIFRQNGRSNDHKDEPYRPIYHMKVENDAVSIHTFLENKAKEEDKIKNAKENKANEYDVILNANRMREIQDTKKDFIEKQLATQYFRITEIDGETHNVEMLFMKKVKGKGDKSQGRNARNKFSTYGRSQAQIVQQEIEEFLANKLDWDTIYYEIIDGNQEKITALHEKEKIAKLLSKDEYFDWRSAMSQVDPLLLDYIKKSMRVDKAKGEVSLHNKENIEANIIQKYRKMIGGKYLMRKFKEFDDDEKKIITKQMICNHEVEMAEFLYDIKIYQVQKISNKDVISYEIEIFTVTDDPDLIYVYNYPMNFSQDIHDPHSLVIDVINLIESPLRKEKKDSNTGHKTGKLGSKNQSNPAGGAFGSTSSGVGSNKQVTKESQPRSVSLHSNQGHESDPGQSRQFAQNDSNQIGPNSFHNLFRKYIDNRVILFIQEQRFPRKLDFILIEPSSQLQWRYHIEPRQITTGTASMHLVDQATIEMFVAVMLDENENWDQNQQNLFEYQGESAIGETKMINLEMGGVWKDIKDVDESAKFVTDCEIVDCEALLCIHKSRESFYIKITKPDKAAQNDNSSDDESYGQQYYIEPLEIRQNPSWGDTQFSKVISQKGLNYYLVHLQVQGQVTIIKVVQLSPTSIKTLFKFQFENQPAPDAKEDEDRGNYGLFQGKKNSKIFTSMDIQTSTTDVLRRYYGSQTIEQALRMCENQKMLIDIDNDSEYEEPTVFEKMEGKKMSVHGTRMISKYQQSLTTKTIVLHRKTFFDDQYGRLFLMSVSVSYPQKEQIGEGSLKTDIETFNIILSEPATGNQEREYITAISTCLTQDEFHEEYDRGTYREIRGLKRLAKRILEERAELRRSGTSQMGEEEQMEGPVDINGPEYHFGINFDRMLSNVEDANNATNHSSPLANPIERQNDENFQNVNNQQVFENQRNNIPTDGQAYIQDGENANNNYFPNGVEGQEMIQSQEQYTGQRAGSNFVDGQSTIIEEAASHEEDQLIDHSHHYSEEQQQF